MPVHEEQVEVEKRAVVYEEVGVGKREVQDTERVSDTVRREEARIERQGDVRVSGDSWDAAMPSYRQRWQARYGTTGSRWEESEPAYRYGYEMRDRPDYRGRTWNEVEPEFQRDWNQRNPNKPWDRVKDPSARPGRTRAVVSFVRAIHRRVRGARSRRETPRTASRLDDGEWVGTRRGSYLGLWSFGTRSTTA